MSIITNNPYQSPPHIDAQGPSDSVDGLDTQVGLGEIDQPQSTVNFGAWAGILFGGTFGLTGALVLALSRGFLLGWPEFMAILSWENVVMILISGSVSGIVCGSLIGPYIGSMVASGRYRLIALLAAAALSALAGATIGQIGMQFVVLSQCPADTPVQHATMVGIAIGGVTGLLGGLQLGRRILAFGESANMQPHGCT